MEPHFTGTAKADQHEEELTYDGSELLRLLLIQTIVAMANTQGGRIVLHGGAAGKRGLDSAALETLVGRYVDPRLQGLEIAHAPDESLVVTVPDSPRKPHVIVESGLYQHDGETRHAFHRGQIWVRQSSGNAEATAKDLQRILFDAAGTLLERIGAQVRAPGFVLREEDALAQPVRLVADPAAPLVRADLDAVYPLTRQKLCDEFHKGYSWISAAMRKLGVEKSDELSYADRNSVGHPTRWRYAESVRDLLRERLRREPEWDPIHSD